MKGNILKYNMWGKNMDYKKAGVDIEAGYKSVELMKQYVKSTMRPEVLTDIGSILSWKD